MRKRTSKADADDSKAPQRKRPPARTLEQRENQLIAKTYDLAERQIDEGTASSQTMSHFLKMGSTKERMEKERLENEIKLLNAKVEALQSAKTVEELYANALDAMRKYSGNDGEVYED